MTRQQATLPFLAMALGLAFSGCDVEDDLSIELDRNGAGACFEPGLDYADNAGRWWREFTSAGTLDSVTLELESGGQYAMASQWGKWTLGESLDTPAGTRMRLVAQGPQGEGRTEWFRYLDESPRATPCETCFEPNFAYYNTNPWWREFTAASGIDSVTLEIQGGSSYAMESRWGRWILGDVHTPEGTTMRLVASGPAGEGATSWFRYMQQDPSNGTCGGGGGDGGGEPTPPPTNGSAIFTNNFNDDSTGTYSRNQLNADWNSPAWSSGVDQGRVEIINGGYQGKGMRVHYPAGGVGPGEGGAQWLVDFDRDYDELYVSYRLRFAPGFDFKLGGKIPGLTGGAANTGGDKPNGHDGWSGRMMWRTNGDMSQYLYHPDQPGTYGEDLYWDVGGSRRRFQTGRWYQVETRIKMNSPGSYNGIVQSWLDGQLGLDRRNIRFRDTNGFSIDALYFSTFFGGGTPEWAPPQNTYIDFDDFVVSTQPITH